MASDPNAHIELDKTEARQGTRKPHLIYVLVAGIVLVIAAFAIASLFGHAPTHPV